CARCWSFESVGSSACLLSSARRARALSKSKMPPQQSDRLLDLVDDILNFRAHRSPARRAPMAGCSDCAGSTQWALKVGPTKAPGDARRLAVRLGPKP